MKLLRTNFVTCHSKIEDYRGPSSSGYFQWMPDEDGRMTPVTKMKGRNVERKTPSFWGNNDE